MRPANEAELSEALRSASGPLRIVGGGTRSIGQVPPGDVLETAELSGVTLYEPGALTLVVGAGMPLAEVQTLLAGENQRLAFEVPDLRALLGRQGESTLGGVVAANASGPRRVQAGACRDSLLGVRFVDGTGTVIKNGGRVMKNVTGYDLVKLMAGSRGTLGVLTEVSLRVQAVPEAEATLSLAGLTAAEAVAAMAVALTSPYDVSGAAWIEGAVLIRVEGMAGSVSYRVAELCKRLTAAEVLETAASAAAWRKVRDVTPFAGAEGAVWRLSLRPSLATEVLTAVGGAQEFCGKFLGPGPRALMDWGGGLLWLLVPEAGDAGAGVIRAALARLGGHATLMRGPAHVQAFPPEPPGVAALTAGLRAKFDPRGVFNQGATG